MTVLLEPRKVQGYGWKPDLPDRRDHLFVPKFSVEKVPGSFDLSGKMPPVYDQGQLGSCTGNGWAAVMEYMEITAGRIAETPSRLFIYFCERVIEGSVGSDSGAEVRTGAQVVSKMGAPPESMWPYDISQFAVSPSQNVYDAAKKETALEYKRIQTGGPGAPLRSAIVQGFPVVFGFPVPDYFESGWNPATQVLPVPTASANIIGGHCTVLVGFDFTLRTFRVPAFKVRNSWGPNWGQGGYYWMDYRWFMPDEHLASDMWVVEKVA